MLRCYHRIPDCSNFGAHSFQAEASDLFSGREHTRAKMKEAADLLQTYRTFFPSRTDTYFVCAVYPGGEIALPDLKAIMEEEITNMGLKYRSYVYALGHTGDYRPGGAQGTFFIDGSGDSPIAYIEDEMVKSSMSEAPLSAQSDAA